MAIAISYHDPESALGRAHRDWMVSRGFAPSNIRQGSEAVADFFARVLSLPAGTIIALPSHEALGANVQERQDRLALLGRAGAQIRVADGEARAWATPEAMNEFRAAAVAEARAAAPKPKSPGRPRKHPPPGGELGEKLRDLWLDPVGISTGEVLKQAAAARGGAETTYDMARSWWGPRNGQQEESAA